ncbi:unnamed protein product [Closterium sp. Naga37s-1]|nr:unnamed protein product [Closterium sp. Naga37s-1]
MTADHARLLKLHDRRRLLRLQGKSPSAKTGTENGAVRAGTGDWTISANVGNISLAEGTVTEVGGGAFYQLGGNMEMTIAGLYWAEVQLGQPVQKFKVQIDTGSDVMWVTCAPCLACPVASTVVLSPPYDITKSSTAQVVDCGTSTCSALQQTRRTLGQGCLDILYPNSGDPRCYYGIQYADNSSSTGYLVKDRLTFSTLGGDPASMDYLFGCGFKQSGNLVSGNHLVDGVMGLNMGALSMLTQMQVARKTNGVFAHCLGGEELGGGSLIFGTVLEDGLLYTSLLDDRSHYYVQLNGISVGGQRLPGIDQSSFSSQPDVFGGSGSLQAGGVIMDSGTTLAMFPTPIYNTWLDAVTSLITLPQVGATSDFLCYDFGSNKYEELSKYFPTVTLHFEGADMTVEPPGYVFLHSNGVVMAACIGWQPMLGGDFSKITVIGDIVLRNHLVVYDTDNMKLGWAPYDCSVGTITADGGEYNVTIIVGANLSPPPPVKSSASAARRPTFMLSLLAAALTSAVLFLGAGGEGLLEENESSFQRGPAAVAVMEASGSSGLPLSLASPHLSAICALQYPSVSSVPHIFSHMDESDFLKALALYPVVRSRDYNENDLPATAASASSHASESQRGNPKQVSLLAEGVSGQQPETGEANLGLGGTAPTPSRSFWEVLQERVAAHLPPGDAVALCNALKEFHEELIQQRLSLDDIRRIAKHGKLLEVK